MKSNLDRDSRTDGNFVLILAFALVSLCCSGFLEACADRRLSGEIGKDPCDFPTLY